MKPILKFAGGKSWIQPYIHQLIDPILTKDTTYFEPFVGSGAVAFELQHPKTVINDLNSELITLYQVVRDHPAELIKLLKWHQEEHCKEHYYEVRAMDRSATWSTVPSIEVAARTLYLNKTCFNGLFRVNSKGYFNTPIGRSSSNKPIDIVQENAILELSQFLKTCEICNESYEFLLEADLKPGDIVFFDPPYVAGEEIKTSGFVAYQKEGWTQDDLIRLKTVCDVLIERGAEIILTNNNTEFVRDLFKNYYQKEVAVRHSLNCKGNNRWANEIILSTRSFPC